MDWYSIKPATPTRAATINFFGEIGVGRPVEEFIAELGNAPIVELRVDSPGGSTQAGLAVYDALKGRLAAATITGRWGSAAIVPVMAAHTITCIASARILIHPAVTYVLGNAAQLRHEAFVLEEVAARTVQIISKRTKQDPATVRAWMAGENYFSATEAFQMRLIDHIYTQDQFPARALESSPNLQSPEGSAGGPAQGPTEQMFEAWLAAFGKFQVQDRAAFLQKMSLWALQNIYE
jgi:ATP-dependent protease ClpP protease subunit